MRREVLHSTALVGGESAAPFAAGPAAADLLASNANRLPQVPRHDPKRLVLVRDPLRGGLGELSAPAGAGIAPGLLLVPHPAADIFLVIQESTDGGRRPAFAGAHSARYSLGVEHAHDPDDGQPTGVGPERRARRPPLLRGGFQTCSLRVSAGPSCPAAWRRRARTCTHRYARRPRSRAAFGRSALAEFSS